MQNNGAARLRRWESIERLTRLGRNRRRGRLRRSQARQRTLESLEPRTILAADLLISEFMAINESGLRDEDGDRSDWIEIFNNGAEAVDLDGWHLTDDPQQLNKWEFPSVRLAPGRSLIVFASDKNRDTAGRELHTNFQLSGSGEFLALVSPDGSTIVDQFNPYPAQFPDVSYGRDQTQTSVTLVSANSPSRRLMPASAAADVAAATWTAVGFNDSSWTSSPAAIGYDQDASDGDFAPLIASGGQLTTMPGQTASVYQRIRFQADTTAPYNQFDLNLNFDDGAVVYLNGSEVARINAADPLAWNSRATTENGAIASSVRYANFLDGDDQDDFNLVGAASWISGRLQLTPAAADQTGAAWLREPVRFGPDYSFSASMVINVHSPGGTFDRDGRGGHGMTFVLQTGGPNALGGPAGQLGLDATGMAFVAVEFDTFDSGSFDPDTTLGTHIGINTSVQGNVARTAVPRFNGDVAFAGQPGPGVDLRYVWIEYRGATKQLEVYFSATDQRPATPTLVAEVDLGATFGGVDQLWAGWTAATGSAYNAHDVRRFELTAGAGQYGLTPRTISLADHQHLLRNGENVLAIHGLNVSADDNDFLLRPELLATRQTTGDAKYFNVATPGEINGLGDEAPTGAVSFSHSTRVFDAPFDLVLTPPNSNAVIRYTTDGKIPTESSTLYSGPIRISTTTKIRARAFQAGQSPGPVQSETFIAIDSSLAQFEQNQPFSSNLPLMIFESFGKNVESQNTSMVPVSGVFIRPGANGRASILDEPEFGGRGGMRIRGQTSEGFAKKQFALELWDELNDDSRNWLAGQVDDKAAEFFDLPAESDWVLNGPYSDKTQLNNFLTFLWSNNAGLYAPRARLVEVFLNQGGGKLSYPSDYRGTYVLLEKIKRDGDRVDIARLTPDDNQMPEISGGYIWKKDKAGAGDVPFTTSRGQELRMVEPDDSKITTQQKNWLRNYINEFEAALYGPKFADPEEGYAKYIDVDSWATTWLLVEMTKNIDGFRLSTYYHKDRNGKITQGPAWDYNLSLANGNYLRGAYPEGWYGDQLSQTDYPYWDRLFEDPNFRQRVVDRWNELRRTVWSTENLLADVDRAVAQLSDGNPRLESPAAGEPSNPISRNFDKWGTLNSYLWPNCFFGQGDCPASPLPNGRRPSRYADYIFILKDFIERRTAWMDSQLPLGPQVAPAGGTVPEGTQVTIEVPDGWQAIYTLDGSDPRQPITVSQEQVLLPAQSPAQILVPTSRQLIDRCNGLNLPDPTACFMSPEYVPGTNGETWISGSLGVGFDEQSDYLPYIQTDVNALMNDRAGSVYVRIPFEVTAAQKAALTNLTLRMRYDDGFVAYLWSDTLDVPVEIARANAPGSSRAVPIIPLAYDATATGNHDDNQAVVLTSFDVSNATRYLRTGTNYLVIQGMNSSLSSSDFLIDAEIVGSSIAIDLPEGVFRYEGPITIDRNVQLNARLLSDSGNTWSGLTTEWYVTDSPQLMITEINYHPAPPTSVELAQIPTLDKNDFEFIEIRNAGGSAVNLSGTRFVRGINFTFPTASLEPGEYAVVVKNEAAFRLRYGSSPRVLGQFTSGTLDNAGETIELVDATGDRLLIVDYDDSSIWPQAADGAGATLELIDPLATPVEQLSKYYRWRSSTEMHGSPGRAGAPRIPIVVNEVLANSSAATGGQDAVELYNAGTTAIDIGGWYLSDSIQNLFKYRIPSGTILSAGGYLLLTESDFNPTPSAPLPHHFALNASEGDDLWLTVPDGAGGVAQFVDDVHFGPSRDGQTFGRVPNGRGFLVPLVQPTLGSANQNPDVGPLVISEVMYHPSAPSSAALAIDPMLDELSLEYIEISNPTGAPIALTNWRLRGGVDFEFPAGRQLAPGASLLILPFDPSSPLNATRLSAFKTHYGIGDSVTLIGPYVGQLSNSADRISLQQPEPPLPNEPNIIPRVGADEIIYDDLAPWPAAADGAGMSLQRIGARSFGHSAGSWKAATPTPGTFVADETLPGDFNGDGRVDGADLDLLGKALQQGSNNSLYDLNLDGRVNDQDRDHMVRDILGTNYGDANLDGLFNSSDLVQVFQRGEYEDGVAGNSTWASGDFNLDGEFDTGDLVLAFQAGAYEVAAQPASLDALEVRTRAVTLQGGWDELDGSTRVLTGDQDESSAASPRTLVDRTVSRRLAPSPTGSTSLFAEARDEYFARLAMGEDEFLEEAHG